MSKPMPAHHKTVAIQTIRLADGYGGRFQIRVEGTVAWWQIVAAGPVTDRSVPPPNGYTWVIVAPARVPT